MEEDEEPFYPWNEDGVQDVYQDVHQDVYQDVDEEDGNSEVPESENDQADAEPAGLSKKARKPTAVGRKRARKMPRPRQPEDELHHYAQLMKDWLKGKQTWPMGTSAAKVLAELMRNPPTGDHQTRRLMQKAIITARKARQTAGYSWVSLGAVIPAPEVVIAEAILTRADPWPAATLKLFTELDAMWMISDAKRSRFWNKFDLGTTGPLVFKTFQNKYATVLDLKVCNLDQYLAGIDAEPKIIPKRQRTPALEMYEAEQSESRAINHTSAQGSAAALAEMTRNVLAPMESRISRQMLEQFKLLGNTMTEIISRVVALEQKVDNLPKAVGKKAIKDIQRTVNSIKADTANATSLGKSNSGQQSGARAGFDISEALASEIIIALDKIKESMTVHQKTQIEEFKHSQKHIQDAQALLKELRPSWETHLGAVNAVFAKLEEKVTRELQAAVREMTIPRQGAPRQKAKPATETLEIVSDDEPLATARTKNPTTSATPKTTNKRPADGGAGGMNKKSKGKAPDPKPQAPDPEPQVDAPKPAPDWNKVTKDEVKEEDSS